MNIIQKAAAAWEYCRDFVIKFAMIALAAVTTTFVYLFQRPVMPEGTVGDVVAGASAVSLVLIYVGLAFAKLDAERRRKVTYVAVAAAAIETIYGTIHVAVEIYDKAHVGQPGLLSLLPDWSAWLLGILHAAPFSILLFLVAQFVFHDPSKDTHISVQLVEAMQKIEQYIAEIAGLKVNARETDEQIGKLRDDNILLQQLRAKDSQNFREELADWEEQRRELNRHMLLLQTQNEQLEAEKAALLEASNSNSSNSTEVNYTERITALLMETPDLTNQELYEMTGFPQGTIKTIAYRIRKKLGEPVLN